MESVQRDGKAGTNLGYHFDGGQIRQKQAQQKQVLQQRALEMHFQPITSVRRGSVVGVEALVRAQDASGQAVSPEQLFHQAQQQNCLRELDERCQSLALETFAPLHQIAPELLLFVNVHPVSVAHLSKTSVSFLHTQAALYHIDPRNLAVEILERRIPSTEGLQKAVAHYRESGFLVVLDDMGAGDSNLDRVTQVQPDIIKVDRSLIYGIADDCFKQEVFKALVQLSERIGGWVITEGIETRDDALTCLDSGGDLLQGYYLGRPQTLPREGEAARAALRRGDDHARHTGVAFRQRAIEKAVRERHARDERFQVVRHLRETLEHTAPEAVEEVLYQASLESALFESACVLDKEGVQLTDTVLAHGSSERQKSVIYAPPAKGSDHSLKEYVYLLMEMPLHEFETQPYVPLPNTDLCVTITARYHAPDAEERILCMHLLVARGVLQSDAVPQHLDTDSPEMPRRHDEGVPQ